MAAGIEQSLLFMRPGRIKYVRNYVFAAFLIGFFISTSFYSLPVPSLLQIALILVPAGIVVGAEIDRKTTAYHLTPSRLIIEGGIASKQRTSMLYHHIADINLYQSAFERLLGYGHVKVSFITAEAVELNYVRKPHAVSQYLDNLVQAYSSE